MSDTGIGISAEQQGLLFRPFSQADATTTRRFGGTELGLCLAKRLARALGGDVVLLRSEPEVGSTFRVSIAAVQSEKRDMPLHVEKIAEPFSGKMAVIDETPSLQGIHVLLVEDGPENRFLIKTLLEQRGADVTCVDNGDAAVENALSAHYDVVLMDIQLPKMDGYMATSLLRAKGYSLPIIAITAHALREDRQRAQESGFDNYFSKPIDWNSLAATISSCTHNPSSLH